MKVKKSKIVSSFYENSKINMSIKLVEKTASLNVLSWMLDVMVELDRDSKWSRRTVIKNISKKELEEVIRRMRHPVNVSYLNSTAYVAPLF